jgi:hypothetical protein
MRKTMVDMLGIGLARLLLLGTLCALVAGCAGDERKEIASQYAVMKPLAEEGKGARGGKANGGFVATDTRWLGTGIFINQHGAPLPARVQHVSVENGGMGLRDILEMLATRTGIPIRPPAAMGKKGEGGVGKDPLERPMPSSVNGTLETVLDRLAAYYGVSWRFQDSVIDVQRWETRTFPLAVESDLKGKVSTGTGGGKDAGDAGGGDGDGLAMLKDVEAAVKILVGDEGEVHLAASTGDITVETTVPRMREVERRIKEFNRAHTPNIAVTVKIIELSVSTGNDLSFSLANVIQNMAGHGQLGAFQSLAGQGNGLFGLVSAGRNSAGVNIAGGGSVDAVVGALSSIGEVASQEGAYITTTSDGQKSVTRQKEVPYIESTTQILGSVSGPGQVVQKQAVKLVGFALRIKPSILPGGRIKMNFDVAADTVGKIVNVTNSAGDVTQQLVPVNRNRTEYSVNLAAGDVAVIGGYEINDVRADDAAPLAARIPLLGGHRNTAGTRIVSVIVVSPSVMAPMPARPSDRAVQVMATPEVVQP